MAKAVVTESASETLSTGATTWCLDTLRWIAGNADISRSHSVQEILVAGSCVWELQEAFFGAGSGQHASVQSARAAAAGASSVIASMMAKSLRTVISLNVRLDVEQVGGFQKVGEVAGGWGSVVGMSVVGVSVVGGKKQRPVEWSTGLVR